MNLKNIPPLPPVTSPEFEHEVDAVFAVVSTWGMPAFTRDMLARKLAHQMAEVTYTLGPHVLSYVTGRVIGEVH